MHTPSRTLAALGLLSLAFAALSAHPATPVMRARTDLRLPDVPGYVTLRCDLHMHTVFSDGTVWPTVRVDEAWREGYDAIAITDHIEYQPHKADIPTNHNRPHEIAKPAGDGLGVIVVKGSEVTRNMPPGHLNAIFLTDSKPLDTKEWRDALAAAHQQGAFIFWNHPGWDRQLVAGKIKWFSEHTELLEQGRLHGIEVANDRHYYPEAHRWAIEKKLTLLGNSDIHPPVGMDYQLHAGDRRAVTLVFAEARTPEAMKKALFARQTAVITGGLLVGDERFLRPLVERALTVKNPQVRFVPKQKVLLQIGNASALDFELVLEGEVPGFTLSPTLNIPAEKTVVLEIQAKENTAAGRRAVSLPYRVKNVLPHPDQPLLLAFAIEVDVAAAKAPAKK